MPTIKPISDLRSYSSVLDTVSVGAPSSWRKMAADVMSSLIFRITNASKLRKPYLISSISEYTPYLNVVSFPMSKWAQCLSPALNKEHKIKLVWSPAAVDDLASAFDYIEFDLANPSTARNLYNTAQEKAHLFAEIPGSGAILRTLNGIDAGYRYMLCGNWMLFMTIQDDSALVVRFLYAKSNYMTTLFG